MTDLVKTENGNELPKRIERRGGRRSTSGQGRPKGVPNKATTNAREAIARFVDKNFGRMQDWLDQIAKKDGPMAAWRCMVDVIEYHVPKLARVEHSGGIDVGIRTISDADLEGDIQRAAAEAQIAIGVARESAAAEE